MTSGNARSPGSPTAGDLLILGCGFTGTCAARRAKELGYRVVATTRRSERGGELERLGVEHHVVPVLSAARVRDLVVPGAHVLVAFAPDGQTDAAIAPELARAARVAYISTTGVYGAHRGKVDETTPLDPAEPRAAERIAAENVYRASGATVLRAAGIYGPTRGLHVRLKSGTFRVPGDGTSVVSRIHVDDLAELALAVLRDDADARGEAFVVADDTPVPQGEVIAWLCQRLSLPFPASVAVGEAPSTLRHDRAVHNRRIKAATGVSLRYPSYREGFEACLAAEACGA